MPMCIGIGTSKFKDLSADHSVQFLMWCLPTCPFASFPNADSIASTIMAEGFKFSTIVL